MKRKYIFLFATLALLLFIFIYNTKEKTKQIKKDSFKIEKSNKKQNSSNIQDIIEKKQTQSLKAKKLDKEKRENMLKKIKEQISIAEKNYQNSIATNKNQIGNYNDSKNQYTGALNKEYIQKQVKEIVPLIKECYDNSLEKNPQLKGKVVVSFTIIGDPDVGGMIESSEFIENTMNSSEEFNNCILDSLYEIELEAPENSGKIKINYPLIFNSDK